MIAIRLPKRHILRVHDLPGSGVPLVFLHGLACASSCDYPAVAASPALAGRRALLVDLLGHGFSDKPGDFAYTIEAQAHTIATAIESLGLAQFDLYGHSMGGAVAIVAASLVPARVRRLVLSEPNLDAGGGAASRAIQAQPEADYVRSGHARSVMAAVLSENLIWAGTLAAASPLAVHRGAAALVRGSSPSWRDTLLTLPMPRAVLFGARSLPDDDLERLPQRGVAVGVVTGAGHSMAWENPAGLAEAIAAATRE